MLTSTTTPPQSSRRISSRKPLALLLSALLAFTLLSSCESSASERNEVLQLINRSRSSAGLKPVKESIQLDMKADEWARKLRDRCALSHSKLSDGAPADWRKLGENVGYGGTISQIHTAYLNSPGHRANIMDGAYNQAGTAAVWGTCDGQRRVFTVQVFMKI